MRRGLPLTPIHGSGLLLTWRDSSEENLPVEKADGVAPYRLGMAGQILGLALMYLAR
jgi:hypothetical protein